MWKRPRRKTLRMPNDGISIQMDGPFSNSRDAVIKVIIGQEEEFKLTRD